MGGLRWSAEITCDETMVAWHRAGRRGAGRRGAGRHGAGRRGVGSGAVGPEAHVAHLGWRRVADEGAG